MRRLRLFHATIPALLLAIVLLGAFSFRHSHGAQSAGFSFSPASRSAEVGGAFQVKVLVNSGGQSVNALTGVISYPSDLLEVVAVPPGPLVSFWIQNPTVEAGSIHFEGVILSPGFTGSNGVAATLTFKAKKEGTATLRFASGSILANDGNATNVLGSFGRGTYTISPKHTSPSAENSGSVGTTPSSIKDISRPARSLDPSLPSSSSSTPPTLPVKKERGLHRVPAFFYKETFDAKNYILDILNDLFPDESREFYITFIVAGILSIICFFLGWFTLSYAFANARSDAPLSRKNISFKKILLRGKIKK